MSSSIEFVDRCYGKNYVRLLHVRRQGDVHHVVEVEVNTSLTLSDTRDYLHGDNSQIVATDSQKNTVYLLAKKHGIESIEKFALILANHFLVKYIQVERAEIHVLVNPWKRIQHDNNQEHNHAFIAEGAATRYCHVTHERGHKPGVTSGLRDMRVLKTTKSSFVNFVEDEFRSLPDMSDRVFCTIVDAKWTYTSVPAIDYDASWEKVKSSILEEFAGPEHTGKHSPSVQTTLYHSAKLIFDRVAHISQITIELPNVHAYEFDMSRFPRLGLTNQGEVFQPVDKPSGNIKATLRRAQAKL